MSTQSELKRIGLSITAVVLFVAMVSACAPGTMRPPPGAGGMAQQAPPPPNPPVLEDSFAVTSVPTGSVWNVFVQGSDPDGDMTHLWLVISQLGQYSETETIPLVGPDRKAFSGYITIFLRGGQFSSWENVKVEIRIRDAAGHVSAMQEHQTQVGFPTKEALPSKWVQAENHKLASIIFDLRRDNDGDMIKGRRQ